MRRVQIVSTPALLEARNLARWIERERVPGVRIAPSRGEWGVFAPAQYAERARRAFKRAVAANNPGGHRVVFKIRPTDPYTVMKKRCTFGRCIQLADMLVKGIVIKAAVLDPKGKVRFVAFKKTASNPGMDALADAAVMMAARGARQYLDVHKLSADPAALTACLKSWVKIKFPEALNDAKAAISAGMHAVAEQTFAATMRLAGIEAAKEAARPPSVGKNQPNKPRFYQDSMGKIHDWNTGAIATLPVSPVVVMSYRTKPPSLFKTWRAGGERHWDYLGTKASTNPRGFVPMEVRGTTQAARLLKFLRKKGLRAKLRRSPRPGWFGFTCAPSEQDKAEKLVMQWSTLSEGMDRPTHKALAAEKRWRMRQRRRRHRRGYRKGGYMMGGKTLPLDRPLPNSRRRARRNGVMSSDEAWAAMQWLNRNDKARYQIARRKTVAYIIEQRGPDSLDGISSSDVNHTMVSLIVQGDISMPSGAPWRKQVRKNGSIEGKWPTMTDRQRREALRLIGIQEDIAELWSSKPWSALSSVVKMLLVRSWRHGGDTTKIRRVPVGAR